MGRFPALEIVSTFGVGYDHIDVRWAAAHGVVVTNTPDVLTEEVADTALGLLINTVREFPRAAARAARLVTPSEFSRREALELLAPGEERVVAIPWAPSPGLRPPSETEIEDFCRRRALERGHDEVVGADVDVLLRVGAALLASLASERARECAAADEA